MTIFRHLRAWMRRGRLDDDLREELAQHREWTVERLTSRPRTAKRPDGDEVDVTDSVVRLRRH